MNPDPIWIGTLTGCVRFFRMILYLVCTLGGTEQASGEPDGERHGALAQGEGEALPQAGEVITEETKTSSW